MAELQILIIAKNQASLVLGSVKNELSDVAKSSRSLSDSMKDFGKGMKDVGSTLTAGFTLPLVGIGTAAIKASTDLNAMMANIQSLGLGTDRVLELKESVQNLAIEMGKSTSDMADGLYQVISTFGDSADAVKSLEIAAKAGAAGLATTTDAINLIAAVTKGYGDTSLEAQQKVSDLAFQTVNLGQTTFPELAAAIGKVVPIAAALGVTQEELFAQMATLTGVTGSTAEVTTQLRATYQALLKPTKEMAGSIEEVATKLNEQGKLASGPLVDAWLNAKSTYEATAASVLALKEQLAHVDTSTKEGAKSAKDLKAQLKDQEQAAKDASESMAKHAAALGPVMVDSIGLTETLALLSDTAHGNTDTLGKMYGSVEALTAVLALSGGQAQSFKEKLAAMQDVTGVTNEAFKDQTEGLNKAGFTMEQLKVKVEVLLQRLGDGLAPSLAIVLDNLTPLINKLLDAATWFANTDESTQKWIIGIAAAVAAIGPLLMVLGTLITTIGALMPVIEGIGVVLAALASPIGLAVAAVVGLYAAWVTNFMGIQDKTKAAADWIDEQFTEMLRSINVPIDALKGLWEWITKLSSGDISLIAEAPAWIALLMAWVWPSFIDQPDWVKTLVSWLWPDFVRQPAWAKTLVEWSWPNFISVPNWVSNLLIWTWPAIFSAPGWISTLMGWDWPDFISMPGWLNDLLNWQWPSMPSWLGGNAQGTTNFAGGLTMVGENGPEIVALPASSRIYTNRESQRLASSGVGTGGGFSIVIQNAYMRSDRDVTQLAYEIDDILKRRRSGWR